MDNTHPLEYQLTLALMHEVHQHLEKTNDPATALLALANAVASVLSLDHASNDAIAVFNAALARHVELIRRARSAQ